MSEHHNKFPQIYTGDIFRISSETNSEDAKTISDFGNKMVYVTNNYYSHIFVRTLYGTGFTFPIRDISSLVFVVTSKENPEDQDFSDSPGHLGLNVSHFPNLYARYETEILRGPLRPRFGEHPLLRRNSGDVPRLRPNAPSDTRPGPIP